ncbi:MAG: shikimate kinase [Bacteroidales bacterium]|nr:shikimate kinase [Bacteroidales bacterium]
MDKPLAIIGFMGSGKTTLGKQMAKIWEYKFIDLDVYITKMYGMSISALFKEYGEAGFRQRESQALNEVLAQNQICILSLGGGTPCSNFNLKLIKEKTLSIYLKLSPEELTNRLLRSKNPRPLIRNKSADELLGYIEAELDKRELFYSQADLTIQSDSIQLTDLLTFVSP